MAEDDSAQSVPVSNAVSAPSPVSSEPSRASLANNDDIEDDLNLVSSEPQEFQDIFSFMVGITPDRVINLLGNTADRLMEEGWTAAVMAVKGAFKGNSGEAPKGKPSDLPLLAKDGTSKGNDRTA